MTILQNATKNEINVFDLISSQIVNYLAKSIIAVITIIDKLKNQ